MRITCIIFDCDGTLVDSEWTCNEARRLWLLLLGVEISTSELVERYRADEPLPVPRVRSFSDTN